VRVTKTVSFSRDRAHFAVAGLCDTLIHLDQNATWTETAVSEDKKH